LVARLPRITNCEKTSSSASAHWGEADDDIFCPARQMLLQIMLATAVELRSAAAGGRAAGAPAAAGRGRPGRYFKKWRARERARRINKWASCGFVVPYRAYILYPRARDRARTIYISVKNIGEHFL
jgi:hypothetical protein